MLNPIATANGGRHHMLYQFTQNPLHSVVLDAKSALGLVFACKSGVDWSRQQVVPDDFQNPLAWQV